MKKECKQKFSANKKSLLRTGGGPPDVVDITNIDLEMRDIIGATSVEGLPPLHDDDLDNNEIFQNMENNQAELIEIEMIDSAVDDAIHIVDQAINNKLIVSVEEIPSTSSHLDNKNTSLLEKNKIHECSRNPAALQKVMQENWSQYSPAMLKKPANSKLNVNQRKRTRTLSQTKSQLYEEVMQAKLNFIKLQEEKFLEEWAIKKRILEIDLHLKEKQLSAQKKQ